MALLQLACSISSSTVMLRCHRRQAFSVKQSKLDLLQRYMSTARGSG